MALFFGVNLGPPLANSLQWSAFWRQGGAQVILSRAHGFTTAMFTFLLWCLLLVFCWPLAVLALVLYPLVWLVLLPFRLIGMTFDAVFETLHALLTLPARLARRLA